MLTTVHVPAEIIEAILQRHLADPSARLADLESEPIPSDGYSGNHLFRVRLAWTSAMAAEPPRATTWVLKRWLPGGHSERLLGSHQPLEVLGWQHGLVRPEALPAGVATPIVGTWLDADGRAAWIAMEDVSPALSIYSRDLPLHPAQALTRARLVLERMARLHVRWERPDRQATLRRCPWLVPMERFLWFEADRCAAALGHAARPGSRPVGDLTDEYRDDLAALLAWLPSADRAMFEDLFCHRERLVSAMRPFPRTLIHGDLDDRNLGLRQGPASGASEEATELVLIDWEWMAFGTPALDVARFWGGFPAVCDLSMSLPEAAFSDELPAYYFEHYRAYGGALLDARAWHRACSLALLGLTMSQVSFIGSMIRHDVAPVVAGLARQLDTITAAARTLHAD
jgi:Phosphotransferase enzyme family